MGLRIIVVALLLSASLSAVAQTLPVDVEKGFTPQERRDTGLDTLSPEQLRLLNKLLREKSAPAPASVPPPAADAATAATAARSGERDVRGLPADLEVRTIKARLKGTIAGWAPDTEFHLDNGQVWKVLKGEMTLRQPLDAPEILVVPGIAGRWFLQVHEDYPKARVYRVD